MRIHSGITALYSCQRRCNNWGSHHACVFSGNTAGPYVSISNFELRKRRVSKIFLEKFLNIETTTSIPLKDNYIFEPDPLTIFAELLPLYCTIKLQSVLNDAYTAELAARIFSMRAATKNAKEMIEKLTLTRNKVRQAGITKELIEITSGAESLR